MDFKLAIMVLEGELSNIKHSLKYNNPHKNSNQYKAYKWRIDELEETIEYLRAQASKQQQSSANCAIFDVSQRSELFFKFIDEHYSHSSENYRKELKESFVEYLKNCC